MKYEIPANIWHQNTGHDVENNQTQRPASALKRKPCSVQLIPTVPCLTYLIVKVASFSRDITAPCLWYLALKDFPVLIRETFNVSLP